MPTALLPLLRMLRHPQDVERTAAFRLSLGIPSHGDPVRVGIGSNPGAAGGIEAFPQGSCKDSRSSSSMSISRGGRTSGGLPYSCGVGLVGTFNSPLDGESPGLVRQGAGPGLPAPVLARPGKTQDEPYTGCRIFNETNRPLAGLPRPPGRVRLVILWRSWRRKGKRSSPSWVESGEG
jgi:hypothetical protein